MQGHILLAHESWFVNTAAPVQRVPDLFTRFQTGTAIAVTGAALVIVMGFFLDRLLARSRPLRALNERLRRYAPWATAAFGMLLAVGLGSAGLNRTLFVPDFAVPDTLLGTIAIALELFAALCIILGLLTRFAAAILVCLYVLAIVWFPLPLALQNIVMLGAAAYLLVYGRGRLSLGSYFSRFMAMEPGHMRLVAVLFLRTTCAVSLVALASVKFTRPDLMMTLLEQYPWNPNALFGRLFGAPLPADWFVFLTALVEASLALLLAGGALLRLVTAALLVGFIGAGAFLPLSEIIYHLPWIATAALLFVIGKQNSAADRA